jgi:uncharacterized repeat protein (TIGR02543 family)
MIKRKLLSLVLVFSMVLTSLPMRVQANEPNLEPQVEETEPNFFFDVTDSDWFYESARYVWTHGLFQGIEVREFSPQSSMTRAMYITVLGRMAEIDPMTFADISLFKDVAIDAWYTPYVQWATKLGITAGVGNDLFDPEGLMSREQMAVMTVNFFEAMGIPLPEPTNQDLPSDWDGIEDYAKEAVRKLWQSGMLQGDENGKMNPQQSATRAEVAGFCFETDQTVERWFVETGLKPAEPNPEGEPEKEPETPKPEDSQETIYVVTFADGLRIVDRLSTIDGYPLGRVPSQDRTAKADAIFVGWFTDTEFTSPFYSEDPVLNHMTVYAKYEPMVKEVVTLASFAQIDQTPNLSFQVEKRDTANISPSMGIVLTVMDGTEAVDLEIVDQENGSYLVKAQNGFREGSSYQLSLADGYYFLGKPDSIRVASFTIAKTQVENLLLNNDMVYIQDTPEMSYQIEQQASIPVLSSGLMNSDTQTKLTGTFDYADAANLLVGQVLCIYQTIDPRERDYAQNNYADDAEAYIEITAIQGNTITFTSLDETDVEKVIFMPDTLPFSVAELPTEDSGSIESSTIDKVARIFMGLSKNPTPEIGDYLVFYEGVMSELTIDSPVYYGVVTAIEGTNLSYKQTTREEIESAMDTYLQQSQKGDDLLDNVDILAITEQIEQQVEESGFAEDAAEYLALMATQTDRFKTLSGIENFSVTQQNGQPLDEETLSLLGLGGSFQLSDNVKITVELDSSSKYFTDGIRLALGIQAEFSVDVGDEGELKIDLSATFVEEIAIDVTVGASADITWIIIFPKFNELSFRTAIDLKNFAGISVDVKMYTVEKEEDSVWDKLKGLKEGQYKQAFEQIEDLKNKIEQAKGAYDKIQGYQQDLQALWAGVPANLTNPAEYENMLGTLGELNVTEELMGMLNLTSKTELDAGVRNLMDRYAEMLTNESEWIQLFSQEIFQTDINIFIFAIGIGGNFVVKGNLNLALGANMEYVIGKRYTFWFDIISKTSGNSQMDLLDERFAFQFYVMGELGLKMGVELEIAAGIISTKIGSIGVTAEFGPYVKMWGYFIYEYEKLRPANTAVWNKDERMMGALYLEFGLYLEMTFKAQVLDGLFAYEPTLLDKEWPLLTAGTRNNVYDFAYQMAVGEIVQLLDEDANRTNGITMVLPESFRLMQYIDLCEGTMEQAVYTNSKFHYTLNNRYFELNEQTGLITVTVPEGVQYMECDLTLTWKTDKLAFSLYDLSVTIPLVWTNLAMSELNQRFTASVKVGNANDGYTTIWSQRVIKNAAFSLPTSDEVEELLDVERFLDAAGNNLKYSAISGYGGQDTEELTILKDTVYYFEVTPRKFTLTLQGVENANGIKQSLQSTASYGESFTFPNLENSGTINRTNKIFTEFLNTVAKDSAGTILDRDITQPIDKGFASELLSGATYTAEYTDASVTATFRFEGVDLDPIDVTLRKGDVPSASIFEGLLPAKNAIILRLNPSLAPIYTSTTYTIVCESTDIPIVYSTITYNSNGGSNVEQEVHAAGSILFRPADPMKAGHTFDAWYSDAALNTLFDFSSTMSEDDQILFAKWAPNTYTLILDVTEGRAWADASGSKSVIYGQSYGALAMPTRADYNFSGWYTARTGGERVTAETVWQATQDLSIYAQWIPKTMIAETDLQIDAGQNRDYDGTTYTLLYNTGDNAFTPGEFTVLYKRQNLDSEWSSEAIHAGLYDVKITRPEDAVYQSFEKTYISKITIHKIARSINTTPTGTTLKANLLVYELPQGSYPGDGIVEYAVSTSGNTPISGWKTSRAFMNLTAGQYYAFVRVLPGEDYLATEPVRTEQPLSVVGIVANAMGYYQGMEIKTSNITNAGTDADISGQFYYVDGSSSSKTALNNEGNDFEKGDTGTYTISGANIDPWMMSSLTIYYHKANAAAGWHCEYVKPYTFILDMSRFPNFIVNLVDGGNLSVNSWFEDDDVTWSKAFTSFKRNITSVGNFTDLPNQVNLTPTDAAYDFTYNGLVNDQYAKDGVAYNVYDRSDAPQLNLQANKALYNSYITYTLNSFQVDRSGLYAAMVANGDTQMTLTVSLQFDARSTTTSTATHTRVITFSLAD